jgi:hypothetical protein
MFTVIIFCCTYFDRMHFWSMNLCSWWSTYCVLTEQDPACNHTMPVRRAQCDDDPVLNTLIFNINMDSAVVRNTGQGKSVFVEECCCPAGYTGLSFEVSFYSSLKLFFVKALCIRWGTGGAVGWGTALQAGRSWAQFLMVSLGKWHNPFGLTVGLRLTQNLTEMSTRNIPWEVNAAGA